MKRIICLSLALLLLFGILTGCAEPADEPDESRESHTETENVSIDSFDEKLLSYISEKQDGNYMISPLSFRYALGLLLAGAEGETKTELLTALGIHSTDEWDAYCTAFNAFVTQFEKDLAKEVEDYREDVKNGYRSKTEEEPYRALSVANSIWKREDISVSFKETYLKTVAERYNAESRLFTTQNAVAEINKWVNENTKGMIPTLLPDGYDASTLAVVLMNALYFKDSWTEPFTDAFTKKADFTTKSGETTEKEFMTRTGYYRYYADDDTQLVILPMEGDVYMTYVLGSRDNLSEKIAKAERRRVTVTIPKMELETSLTSGELVNFLKENGVQSAFNNTADFSGMLDYDICVDDILQKTKIKLDEDGVEASAVTAIMMKNTAMPTEETPIAFTADRPFTFYIYANTDNATTVLFAGELVK